jgi:hypothetical protein
MSRAGTYVQRHEPSFDRAPTGAHPAADLLRKSGAQTTVLGYQIFIFSPFWLQ